MNASTRFLLPLLLTAVLAACGTTPTKPVSRPVDDGGKPTAQVPDKGDPQARFNAALAQFKAKQIQEAEQAFTELTKDFPQYSGPWTNLGIIYANSNRKPLALVAFNKAAVANQDNAAAWNWIGILSREQRDYARAQAAYERVLKLQPDNALAHFNLAILLDEYLKRPADALPHYKEYQRLSGKQDLRVLAWVAEIEAAAKAAAPPPAPAAAAPQPAGQPAPSVRPAQGEKAR